MLRWPRSESSHRTLTCSLEHRIESSDAVNGTVVAGESGVAGAWSYQFSSPTSITFDQFGNMYIMDSGNNRIQRWAPLSTYGVTVASASMSNPRGLVFDTLGNLLVSDCSNHRLLSFPVSCRESFYPLHFSLFRPSLPALSTTTTVAPTSTIVFASLNIVLSSPSSSTITEPRLCNGVLEFDISDRCWCLRQLQCLSLIHISEPTRRS